MSQYAAYPVGLFTTGTITVAIIVAVAIAGQLLIAWLVPVHHRRAHNDVLGFASMTAGTIYAVMLAFIASQAWTSYSQTSNNAGLEAGLVADLYRDSSILPAPIGARIQGLLQDYVRIVIDEEWPAMAEKRAVDDKGWRLLNAVRDEVVRTQPDGVAATYIDGEMLKILTTISDMRRTRLVAAMHGALHPLVWGVALAGGLVIFGFCWLFGAEKSPLHLISTGLVAVCLGLVIYLINSLNHPFVGSSAISTEPFKMTARFMESPAVTALHVGGSTAAAATLIAQRPARKDSR